MAKCNKTEQEQLDEFEEFQLNYIEANYPTEFKEICKLLPVREGKERENMFLTLKIRLQEIVCYFKPLLSDKDFIRRSGELIALFNTSASNLEAIQEHMVGFRWDYLENLWATADALGVKMFQKPLDLMRQIQEMTLTMKVVALLLPGATGISESGGQGRPHNRNFSAAGEIIQLWEFITSEKMPRFKKDFYRMKSAPVAKKQVQKGEPDEVASQKSTEFCRLVFRMIDPNITLPEVSPADKGPPDEAQRALADYIADKYRPTRKARDIERIDIADVLTIYLDDCGDEQADRKKFEGRISRLNSFWGGRMLSDVSTATCKEYVKVRGNTGGARRDLEDLRAAIGHHASENLHRAIVKVWLPPKGAPRNRWLTRSEVARLLWACWRHREIQTRHRGADKGRKLPTEKRPLRHLSRFILIGVYTGTRGSAIASASPKRAAGRSFVDLERGVYYRLPQGTTPTKKRQPPAPIPARLLAHMRRWERLGLVGGHFVEFNGKPIRSVKTAFSRAVRLADLSSEGGKIVPHTLRHTAATWLMQRGASIWEAAGYLGMSAEMLERVYGHHSPYYLKGAATAITGKDPRRRFCGRFCGR